MSENKHTNLEGLKEILEQRAAAKREASTLN
jgi:hypothetical protein